MFGLGAARAAKVRVWLKPDAVRRIEEGTQKPDEAGADTAPVPHLPEISDLSEEEVDRVVDAAAEAIREILGGFGTECTVDEYEGDYGEVILDVVGDDLAVLIGRHGRTLDSFQVLVGAIAYRKTGLRHQLLVDVGGYRYRRKAKLDEIARGAAERAKRNAKPVALRPMSSYERKVIHMALRGDARVVTESEGEEPFRHVVVNPRR
ncbi:MAG: single-stranded DNA-binding protein [Coriobacteriaceae bacterium]|nr:single-stranded DNA-binding protein [Coriobacteriaceae bacterium]